MAQQLAGLAGILQNIQIPPGVYPTSIQLPSPPKLEGALAPNDLLSKAKRHAYNRVFGPESMVVYKGYVYTGQADGWLVEVSPFGAVRKLARFATRACPRMGPRAGACGRPMGIRLDKDGFLIVADAYHGIFRVNPKSGRYRQLVNPRIHRPKNRALGFINDLTLSKDGLIFFTSSSTKWPQPKEQNIVLEGDYSGRVLYYNPHEVRWTQRVQEVLTNLSFPNGLQIAKDDSYLLVGEGTTSRIHRVWLGPKPPKPQRLEVFAENLPGVVGNIRLSPRGTYWVGFSQTRLHGLPSILDLYGRQPRIRGALITLMNNGVAFHKNRYGMVVEMDGEGRVIRSLQDPQSKVYTSVSEVQEENGILFLASPEKTFIGFMKLPPSPAGQTGSNTGSTGSGTVPPGSGSPGSGTGTGTPGTGTPGTGTPGTGTPGTGTPGTGTPGTSSGAGAGIPSSGGGLGSPSVPGLTHPLSQNPKVIAFLNKVRNNAMRMTADRIRQVVMALIKQLILVKRQAILVRRLADGKEEELQRIKQVLRQLQQNRPSPGTQSPLPPTTAASPTVTDTTPAAGGQESSSTSASVEASTTATSSSGPTSGGVTTSNTDTPASTASPGTTTAASVQTTGSGESGSSGTSTAAAHSETSTATSTTNVPTTTVEITTTTNAPATTTTTATADITTTTTAAAATTTTTSESTTTTAVVEATTTTTTTTTTAAATTESTTAVESTTTTTGFVEG